MVNVTTHYSILDETRENAALNLDEYPYPAASYVTILEFVDDDETLGEGEITDYGYSLSEYDCMGDGFDTAQDAIDAAESELRELMAVDSERDSEPDDYEPDYNEDWDTDDTTNLCVQCGADTQFGGLCQRCHEYIMESIDLDEWSEW